MGNKSLVQQRVEALGEKLRVHVGNQTIERTTYKLDGEHIREVRLWFANGGWLIITPTRFEGLSVQVGRIEEEDLTP